MRHERNPNATFDERLRSLAEDQQSGGSSSIVAGAIQVIALADVKTELHDEWASHADRIETIAVEEIEKQLGPLDFYKANKEHTFTICFASLPLTEAREAASRISRRIRARVLSEVPRTSGRIRVDRFVSEVDANEVLGESGQLSDALHNSLQRMRREAADRMAIGQASALREFRVLFQPVWDLRRSRTGMNRCLIDHVSGSTVLSHLRELTARDELTEAAAHLDGMLFTKSLQGLHEMTMSGGGRHVQIVVPVHFSTLNDEGLPGEYLALVQAMPPTYHRSVLLEIHHVPPGADVLDLLDVFDQLQNYVYQIVLQLAPRDPRIGARMGGGLWGLSADLSNWRDRSAVLSGVLASFVEGAAEKGLRTLAYGANTLGTAQAARAAGVDCIAGSAIQLAADTPKPPTYLNPMLGWERRDGIVKPQFGRGPSARSGGDRAAGTG